jgi:pyrroline-5-carboxylate reductase
MMMSKTIGFYGTGPKTEPFIQGFLSTGKVYPRQIIMNGGSRVLLDDFAERYKVVVLEDREALAAKADLVLLTGERDECLDFITNVGHRLKGKCAIVSLNESVSLQEIEQSAQGFVNPIRAYAGPAVRVDEGLILLCPGPRVADDTVRLVFDVLSLCGLVIGVADEVLMKRMGDYASLLLAASIFFAEISIKSGMHAGLNNDISKMMSTQTFLGASRMMLELPDRIDRLLGEAAPTGSAADRGLDALRWANIQDILNSAVAAALTAENDPTDEPFGGQ